MIASGKQDRLFLGDLSTKIDFGYAKEYMEAAWNILQLQQPDDFIIVTGEVHSLEEVVTTAFEIVGLDPTKYVEYDKTLKRPGSTTILSGDATKARETFNFQPKVGFKELIRIMVDYDLKLVR